MTKFIAGIINTPETEIATELYTFIQDEGELPSDETVFELLKASNDLTEAFHQINRLFLKHLKDALLNAVSAENRAKFSQLLLIEEHFDDVYASCDSFTLQFQSYVIKNPRCSVLREFYKHLAQLDKALYANGAELELTFSILVKSSVIDEIKKVVKDGVLEQKEKSSCGLSSISMIELGFIRHLAKTNAIYQEYLQHIWQVLENFKPELIKIQVFNPAFIVLYGSEYFEE